MEERKKRSRSYPGYSLEESIRCTERVRAELGSGPHDRESIAYALGSTGLTGASTRKIGSMVHFGLLRRDSGGYSFSALSERILHPISAEERHAAILEAFLLVDLYAELLRRFEADGRVPSRLANILVRDHGIEDAAAEQAAKVFLLSGRYSGLIDDEDRIVTERPSPSTKTVPTPAPSAETDYPEECVPPSRESEEAQHFFFRLTKNRSAELRVPSDLCPGDVKLIQKQVEVLALQVELCASAD